MCWENTKWNQYNKWLFNLVFLGETFDTKDITRLVFPANLLANVLTNKPNNKGKYTTQYNSINLNNQTQ